MKNILYTIILSLLFSSVCLADWDAGMDAYNAGDFQTALKNWIPLAEQGDAKAQSILGLMYENGKGVLQDYALAHMWWNICGSGGNEDCVKSRYLVEERMTPSQIEKAQEMARNWKPKK